MEQVAILGISVAISLLVLYFIIQSASGAITRKKQLRLQNQILLHIAKKLEVDQTTLSNMEQENQQL